MKLNDQIESLRAEGSSPEAKGRVIQKIQETNTKKTMKLIGKLSIPAALAAAVAVGAVLTMPRTALASPATVAKAMRNIKDYVINSFTVLDGKRVLTSITTMTQGKANRQFLDAQGKLVQEGSASELDGALFELAVGESMDVHAKGRSLTIRGDARGNVRETIGSPLSNGAKGENSVEVRMVKGPNGQLTKHYKVNGKEVKELPAGMKEKLDMRPGSQGQAQIVLSDKKLGDKSAVRSGFAVVQGDSKGGTTMFQSGQTSVDYLLMLLDDPSRWNIDRGVVFNGQKFDKFTLTGSLSPIELYVDPTTSLPRVLRFVGLGKDGPQIEDEYVYEAIPPQR